MTELEERAARLGILLEKAPHHEQMKMHPRVERVISALQDRGLAVPPRLRYMNEMLRADAIEDMFDNMPV